MSILCKSLPAPVHVENNNSISISTSSSSSSSFALTSKRSGPPPYGARKGWVPRSIEDFGDGGAFPEIGIVQFPLNMGKKGSNETSQTVALTTDSSGEVKYDAILQQGRSHTTIVKSTYKDLSKKEVKEEEMQLPDEDIVQKETEETRLALEKIVQGKQTQNRTTVGGVSQREEPTYIRYTPFQKVEGNAQQRLVRMVEMQVDPLEPPKFEHKKVPRSAPSPPVPIMHSPPRKLTSKEISDWKIPPCVSNWKNHKGHTIPLDKRQAADGRAHMTVEINDNFAKLAEALVIAQETAAAGIKARIQEKEAQQRREKEAKEEELRKLARAARLGRTGGVNIDDEEEEEEEDNEMVDNDEEVVVDRRDRNEWNRNVSGGKKKKAPDSDDESDNDDRDDGRRQRGRRDDVLAPETKEEREARRVRDAIRFDRRKERERERRLEELDRKGVKLSKLTRDRDRDISEKIALGVAQKTGGTELQYDQRLFNQNEGMDSGFGPEDDYNVYDKPLFKGSAATSIYKHKKGDEEQYGKESVDEALKHARFRVDKEFSGGGGGVTQTKEAPVQFEKHKEDEDLFGIDQFFHEAKNARKAMDKVGSSKGMMAAAGESNHKDAESYSSNRRSRLDFERRR